MKTDAPTKGEPLRGEHIQSPCGLEERENRKWFVRKADKLVRRTATQPLGDYSWWICRFLFGLSEKAFGWSPKGCFSNFPSNTGAQT